MIYTHKYESKLLGNILLAADLESEHEENLLLYLRSRHYGSLSHVIELLEQTGVLLVIQADLTRSRNF